MAQGNKAPTPPATEKAKVSRDVVLARERFIENYWLQHTPEREILSVARREFNISHDHARRILRQVRERVVAEHEAERSSNRAQQVARLHHQRRLALQDLTKAETAGERAKVHQVVIGIEKLLADILGTREPIAINLEVSAQGALQVAVAALTVDQIRAIANEQLELEERALSLPAATRVAAPRHEPGR